MTKILGAIILVTFFYPGVIEKTIMSCKFKRLNEPRYDSVFALYQYRSKDDLAGISIELINNKNFYYSVGTDIQQAFSSGKWEITRDTLILRSKLNKNEIPITVNEYISNIDDSLNISWVKNLRGDIVKEAQIFFDADTTKSCMPVFNECKFKKGVIRKIKISFDNGYSKWYEFKNIFSTKIEPIVNIDFSLDRYIFLTEKKFLVRKEGLYELREEIKKNNGIEKVFLVRENSMLYKRVK